MSSELSIWWIALCVASAINVGAWFVAARLLARRRAQWDADAYAARRQLLWLAAAYLGGCAFRSLLPMIEISRICLHDVWISRAVVTRSVATVAELCFAAQWALLLREAGMATGSRLATRVSGMLVAIVIGAELCCWYAVLADNYLLHALENAQWTLAATLVVSALAALCLRVGRAERRLLAAAIACGSAYVAYMVVVDVPMYLSRWQAALAAGEKARPLRAGWQAALQRCIVENDWAVWREDAVWLALYFTAGVWASILLVHAPQLTRRIAAGKSVQRDFRPAA